MRSEIEKPVNYDGLLIAAHNRVGRLWTIEKDEKNVLFFIIHIVQLLWYRINAKM